MNDPGWDKLVDAIELNSKVIEHGKYDEPLEDKPDLKQSVRFLVFERDGKTYRAERIGRPRVIDRKSLYHRSATGNVTFENVYDPDEITYKTELFVKQNDAWQALDADSLS